MGAFKTSLNRHLEELQFLEFAYISGLKVAQLQIALMGDKKLMNMSNYRNVYKCRNIIEW